MGTAIQPTVILSAGAEWAGVRGSLLILSVILLAGLGTGILFVASILAYRQRRSTEYLLITVAVGILFLRSVGGFGTVMGHVPMVVHHLMEHSFDFLIAALVLYAVYQSKPSAASPESETLPSSDGNSGSNQ